MCIHTYLYIIHDLNKIQDLRMVPFRGKIQAFISLLKETETQSDNNGLPPRSEIKSAAISSTSACTDLQ